MSALTKRRRALLASSGSAGITLSQAQPGNKARIGSDNYVVVNVTNTSVILLRELVTGSTTAVSASTTDCNYDGSLLDTYCTTTYKSYLPAAVIPYLVSVPFSYSRVNAGTASTQTIDRDIRIPTRSELNSSVWLTSLKTYHNSPSESDNYARRALNSGGSYEIYWLADGYTPGSGRWRYLNNTGAMGYTGNPQSDTHAMRPVLNMSLSTPVTMDGTTFVIGG